MLILSPALQGDHQTWRCLLRHARSTVQESIRQQIGELPGRLPCDYPGKYENKRLYKAIYPTEHGSTVHTIVYYGRPAGFIASACSKSLYVSRTPNMRFPLIRVGRNIQLIDGNYTNSRDDAQIRSWQDFPDTAIDAADHGHADQCGISSS